MTSAINIRASTARVVQRLAIESLGAGEDRERWLEYEKAKRALREVCEDSQELTLAVRSYIQIVGL